MEQDKQIAEYEAKAAHAEQEAAKTTDPEIAKEWRAIARIYRLMAETRRKAAH